MVIEYGNSVVDELTVCVEVDVVGEAFVDVSL